MEAGPQTRAHPLEILDVIEETADAVSIVFAYPGGTDFAYAPGQFLTLRIPGTPAEGRPWAPRCYSLSSAPALDEHLKVTVKRTVDGYASNWLCDNAAPGMTLGSLPPGGRFTLREPAESLILFAAGSGITPIISIARTALATSRSTVTLVYANRDPDSVIFRAEIADLAGAHHDRFRATHWFESERGLPDAGALREAMGTVPEGASVYACGPTGFMDAATTAAHAAGVDGARIHREAFVSLTADPFVAHDPGTTPAHAVDDASGEESGEESGDAATVTVTLDGSTIAIRWPRTEVLLDTLLARGLDAPYVCREGNCGGCAFTLKAGEVRMLVNDTLDDYELGNGTRLACQSLPLADELEIEFD